MTQTRITAGEWRGRLIDTPPGHRTRPTSSKVREALFNILGQKVVEARVLDLYAGAGTLAFEALSRGAEHVTVVEQNRSVLRLIEATAMRVDATDSFSFVCSEVGTWLRQNDASGFDICFMDPPYLDDGVGGSLELIGAQPPPLVICEHHTSRKMGERFGQLLAVREAKYGQTSLTFYERDAV